MRVWLFVLLWSLGAASAPAQTFLRQVKPGETDVYRIELGPAPATVSMTGMWNRITASLSMEIYCGTEWDTVYPRRGLAVSTHDRMMRLDVGLEGGLECLLYVDTNATCVYAMNFALYGELTLTPVVLGPFIQTAEAARGSPERSSDDQRAGGGRKRSR